MQTFFRKWVIAGIVSLFLLSVTGNLRASISIEVAIGSIPNIAVGDVGLLVVDVDGDGFQLPQEGIQLASGNSIGVFDDLILAVFAAEDGDHWGQTGSGIGFSGIASAINLDALGIPASAPLKFYWLPGKRKGDTTVGGETWHSFRNDLAGPSGGTTGFLTPNEFGVYRISYLSTEVGGSFDSANPGNSGEYETGLQLTLVTNLASEAISEDTLQLTWDANPSAQGYQVYRSSTPDFGSSSVIGSTTDLSFTDSGLPVGDYYYWVETMFTEASSFAALDTAASTVLALPLLSVQKATVKLKGTKTGKGKSFLHNSGPGDGSFLVSGSKGDKYAKLKYFKTTGGRANVTAQIRAGIHATAMLPNSDFEGFEVQAKPSGAYKSLVRKGRVPGKARKYIVNLRANPAVNAVGTSSTRVKFVRKP